jgi:hypothetical protein
MDQLAIFNYELDSDQISYLHNSGTPQNPMAISGNAPIAYYPLGGGSTGSASTLTVPNESVPSATVFDFDGSSTKITFSEITFSTASTLSAWVKRNTTANMFLFGNTNSGGYGCYFVGTSGVYVQGSGGYFAFTNSAVTTAMSKTDWVNWVFIKDSSTNLLSVYVDGVLAQSKTNTAAGMDSLTSIGGSGLPTGTQYIWDGLVSNVSLFNTALPATGTESVESLYNYGTPPNIASYSNLQAWWELDASATFDGSNWSIPDASSNSNTGTSSGMTAANLVQSDLIINQSYDPFSLSFDGIGDRIDTPSIDLGLENTISFWAKRDGTNFNGIVFGGSAAANYYTVFPTSANTINYRIGTSANTFTNSDIVSTLGDNQWFHCALVRNNLGADVLCYINGDLKETLTGITGSGNNTIVQNIGSRSINDFSITGFLSNISIYNSALSASQVKTLYNEHKPFDLNNFEVTPVSWWRLGSVNSSFDGTNWTVLDEIGTNNGTSANMTQSDLVDGVGATGSGTSSGMSSGTNITGNAPYSTSNSVSYNMSVSAKSTSVPT